MPVDALLPIAIAAPELWLEAPMEIPPDRSDTALVPMAIAFEMSPAVFPPTAAFTPIARFPDEVVAPPGATFAPYPSAIEPVSVMG
ncbi:hypothetical protein [Burkholderia cepacia]|uniref:hypothetical protein n=1 Tax=Burkholderia cepacia TaxID=292 RepID=UPI001FC86E0D|nr:hypothetical protein [Burkholderia cepacia]